MDERNVPLQDGRETESCLWLSAGARRKKWIKKKKKDSDFIYVSDITILLLFEHVVFGGILR